MTAPLDRAAFAAERELPGPEPLVACAALMVRRDGRALLENVDLAVRPGEIVTLIGPNGAGKTTLLRVLTGAVEPSAGTVSRRVGLRIGYMPQKLAVDRAMPLTVDRFLRLGERRAGPSERREAMARVGIESLEGAQISELSGGELQRALLARAVLRRPDLLALDEPTQGLDHRGVASLYALIEDLRRDLGVGVLLVSHDLHVVMGAADRVVCLNRHVCCAGTPELVSAHPEYRRLLGDDAAGSVALYRHRHDHDHEPGPPRQGPAPCGLEQDTADGNADGRAAGGR